MKKKVLPVIALAVIVAVVLAVWFLYPREEKGEEGVTPQGAIDLGRGFSYYERGSSYRVAAGKTQGAFQSGQEADILLSGVDFNDAGGSLFFNHPGNVASDGTRLVLADRNNNRVLVWNHLPDGNREPDLVLGQKDFKANEPGSGLDGMNWPVGVATDGRRLLVADAYNDRILVWNTFPTESGRAADYAIGKLDDLSPMTTTAGPSSGPGRFGRTGSGSSWPPRGMGGCLSGTASPRTGRRRPISSCASRTSSGRRAASAVTEST